MIARSARLREASARPSRGSASSARLRNILIDFCEASRGSARLREAPRGFCEAPRGFREASARLREAPRGFREALRGYRKLQYTCIYKHTNKHKHKQMRPVHTNINITQTQTQHKCDPRRPASAASKTHKGCLVWPEACIYRIYAHILELPRVIFAYVMFMLCFLLLD